MGSEMCIRDSTRIGNTASNSVWWMADSSVVALAGEGRMSVGSLIVSISGSHGSVTKLLSIDVPTISSASPVNIAFSAGRAISLYGHNFGTNDMSVRTSFSTVCSCSTWTSDSSLRCQSSVRSVASLLRESTQDADLDYYVFVDGSNASWTCLLYTSPSPRDRTRSRMPSSA